MAWLVQAIPIESKDWDPRDEPGDDNGSGTNLVGFRSKCRGTRDTASLAKT